MPDTATRLCSICKTGELTEKGDCLNWTCVASARLPLDSEDERGTYNVDGSYTAKSPGGTFHGTMRFKHADPEWFEAVMAWAKVYALDNRMREVYGPCADCEGMGV